MAKTTFDRGYLLDELGLLDSPDPSHVRVIHTKLIGASRWSLLYEIVFQLPTQPSNEAWSARYSRGATECQDESPWEYDAKVECTLVRATEKTVAVWEPV